MRYRRLFVALAATTSALLPVDAVAQLRTLGTVGLGRTLRPVGARAIALGNAGVALHDNLSAVSPASLARLNSAGVWVTFQPEKRTLKGDLVNGVFETADFPLTRVALPMSNNWVIGVSFGSLLDQDWGVGFTDTLSLSTGDVAFAENRTSDGGIAQLRFELARAFSDKLALGLAGLFNTGETRLTVTRDFEESAEFSFYRSTTAIRYQGLGLAFGAEYQPREDVIVGAVMNWNSNLTVRDDSARTEVDVGLPVGLDVGGSFRLTPDFLVALALGWTNWSSAQDDLGGEGVVDAWRLGGGTELRVVSGNNTSLFLRLGGHLDRLPFELEGGAPWERALSVGGGAMFRGGRGRVDAAVEFGGRGDVETNLVEEDFIRYSFTLAVFTF